MQVLIIGAGPTGLLLGSLLRDQNVAVIIIEKREKNTRRRPVKLLGRILDVRLDDELNFFSEAQMTERTAAIESIKLELFSKMVSWLEMTTPIQTIQEELKKYFLASGGILEFKEFNMDEINNYPDRLIIDCSGYNSVLLEQIQPNNRTIHLAEYVIVWTFTINARYECNEMCKYYKNKRIKTYHVIPSVHDTYIDKHRNTHVTCLITINEQIFDQLSQVRPLTFDYLLANFPDICVDMDKFLQNFSANDVNYFPNDVMEFVALPLNAYYANKTTKFATDVNQHWVLMGDAAVGGPYFQSISIGYEAAIYFAYIFKNMAGNVEKMLTTYEAYIEKLWFTIRTRSNEIQRNKEILKALCAKNVDDVVKNLKIY